MPGQKDSETDNLLPMCPYYNYDGYNNKKAVSHLSHYALVSQLVCGYVDGHCVVSLLDLRDSPGGMTDGVQVAHTCKEKAPQVAYFH